MALEALAPIVRKSRFPLPPLALPPRLVPVVPVPSTPPREAEPANPAERSLAHFLEVRRCYSLILVQTRYYCWKPDIRTAAVKDPNATPKAELKAFALMLQAWFARAFNETARAKGVNKLAVLLAVGGVTIIHGVQGKLPADPCAFPVVAETPMRTREDAIAECGKRNAVILEAEQKPATWWIPIRDVAATLTADNC